MDNRDTSAVWLRWPETGVPGARGGGGLTSDDRADLTILAHLYSSHLIQPVTGHLSEDLCSLMVADIPRVQFLIELVRAFAPSEGDVADVGGGITLFAPALARLGYRSVLVDDFSDARRASRSEGLETHRFLGVEIHAADVADPAFHLPAESFDVVAGFDVIEQLRHSPRRSLHRLMAALRPGGALIVGVPNGASLWKKLALPRGIGHSSPIEDWYDEPAFRGRARQPGVRDLRYIAADLRLEAPQIVGRNWRATPLADGLLRLFPSLCSHLYLIGRKG